MTDALPARPGTPAGYVSAPDEVWERAREDYLAGLSAPQVCRRHGLNVSTLRGRAARDGWRRADQPWSPPHRLDPLDEGVILEAEVAGDLDQIEPRQLVSVAERRMFRAVLRGDAAEAMRWLRVRDVMRSEQADLDRWIAAEAEREFQRQGSGSDPDRQDNSYDSDDSYDSDPVSPV